ncbi:Histone-lysine N-methyltransferase ASHR1 [Choanephora cucurbitarum]|uniref:Histone-lysine N-methyltransferase ASHR1 n=1 Tax=Choanephora cucurbitarum TaxID=101091 RepID=A0A1C7NJJ6_9FUNG|nr:Histone-lysine N-methyltransferase ASHR1 [Choanephora cucurbitarum]
MKDTTLDDYIGQQTGVYIQDGTLVASEQIKPGTTLLVEQPLSSVPLPSKRHQRCNYCLRKAQLQCCSRCRSAYFCSNECFRNAWLHFHRVLCEPQVTDIYKDVDTDRWLLERTALTLHSHIDLNKRRPHSPPHLPFTIHALNQLQVSQSSTTPTQTVHDVAQFLASFDNEIASQDLDDLWLRIQKCSFPIQDSEHYLDQVAVGVYPITALLVRHSCRPNAALTYKQETQCIIALEDISPGEPITISYIDLISTKAQRMMELKVRFGQAYECHCVRCEGNLASIDKALEKGELLALSEQEASIMVEEQIKQWSVLKMMRHAEQREKDSWSPLKVLKLPEFAHYVSRISAPDLYSASFGIKKNPLPDSTYKLMIKEDRTHLMQRIPLAAMAILNVPLVPSFTIATICEAERVLKDRIMTGRWVEASRCALYLYIAYRLLYPLLHPKLAYHTLVLARSGWNALVEMELIGVERKLERIYANGARAWIELAKYAVGGTFGSNSTLWRDVVELQWVYDRERKVKANQ